MEERWAPTAAHLNLLLANVCAGFLSFCVGACGEQFALGLVGALGGSVDVGGTGAAGLPLCINRIWSTQTCLALDTRGHCFRSLLRSSLASLQVDQVWTSKVSLTE